MTDYTGLSTPEAMRKLREYRAKTAMKPDHSLPSGYCPFCAKPRGAFETFLTVSDHYPHEWTLPCHECHQRWLAENPEPDLPNARWC